MKATKIPEPVIVRVDPDGELILFFPTSAANYGNIACWQFVGEHGESSLAYYNLTKAPAPGFDIRGLLDSYSRAYPHSGNTYVARKQLQMKFLQRVWRRKAA